MLTLIVGAQYGGEGKGKVCAYLAKYQVFGAVSRCGGVNSSHTIVEGLYPHISSARQDNHRGKQSAEPRSPQECLPALKL